MEKGRWGLNVGCAIPWAGAGVLDWVKRWKVGEPQPAFISLLPDCKRFLMFLQPCLNPSFLKKKKKKISSQDQQVKLCPQAIWDLKDGSQGLLVRHKACDNFPSQGTELPVYTGNMDSYSQARQEGCPLTPFWELNPDPSRDKPQGWQGLSFWVQHRLQSLFWKREEPELSPRDY